VKIHANIINDCFALGRTSTWYDYTSDSRIFGLVRLGLGSNSSPIVTEYRHSSVTLGNSGRGD